MKMTYSKAYSLLECIATNMTGELMSEQNEKHANYLEEMIDALDLAMECVIKVGKSEFGKWIPTNKKIPNLHEYVLIFICNSPFTYIGIGCRVEDCWWRYGQKEFIQNEDVKAWMPLPESYKEGENEC